MNVTELRADDRDADALMFAAEADHLAFRHGIYVDADGRRAVTLLQRQGYPRTVAMRLAIQLERAGVDS